MKRLIISAPGSGSGKTTVTLAIMAALRKRGLRVAPFKVGPDYIDPQLHRRVCGRPSYNLDSFFTGPEGVLTSFQRGSRDAEIAIIEGAMGLFDGSSPDHDLGSAAEIARILDASVVLVVDAAGMAGSIGALVHGFSTYNSKNMIGGVIANRLGSKGHFDYLAPAIARSGARSLGYLLRDERIHIPERHLGLLPADEDDRVTPLVELLAELAESHFDLDGLLELGSGSNLQIPARERTAAAPRVRIGWADDQVFHFSYRENLDLLEEAGAEIVPFSPLRDSALPANIDALWLSGGFPECFARELSDNRPMIDAVRNFKGAIYAECGGLMYLCEWFEEKGERIPLVGRVPGGTRMTPKLQRFGYAEATLLEDSLIGKSGTQFRGHRFHYSERVAPESGGAYRIRRRMGGEEHIEGFHDENVLATYFHIHLGNRPEAAAYVVDQLERRR